jgi:phenylacetate-CoA ligase
MNGMLSVYYGLPGPARTAVTSARGLYLRKCRYGPQTPRLVARALERDHWSAERWGVWRAARLELILRRAATEVPYYRDYWASRGGAGDQAAWMQLENWPILEKDALRADPTAFVAVDRDPGRMLAEHTSGTTGKALTLYYTRETTREWYALFEARWRRWYGVSRNDRWANLGGQIIVPAESRRPPFWVWNAAFHQLYMSSYHLAPDLIPYYLDALRRYRVTYLFGYTSSLYALAQEALRLGRRDLKMAVAITNAEPIADYQRWVIADAFQCPVRETYGMSEMVTGASECEAGQLHLWPEAGVVEALNGDQPARDGEPGDLVCTGLHNPDMPLIRYRLGDRVVLSGDDQTCLCGRTLPKLRSVEGRLDDVLYTADGRRVGRLDPVFKADLPVREAQIVQESLRSVRVRYLAAPGFNAASGREIAARLRARLGPVDVLLEPVDALPRGANGKFRAVICSLPPSEVPRCT